MSIFSRRLALAFVVAALCPGGRTARAQAAPVSYWTPSWPIGFGGNLGQTASTYGNFPGFNGSDAGGSGYSFSRYNFSNGWFVGNESRSLGLGTTGIDQGGAFSYQGTQFGYNFQNAPLTVYGGIGTLKYNAGNGGPFASFDSTSSTLPGYSAHVGVAYQPTSNLSLSLGVGYTQQQVAPVGSINSLTGASPFSVGR
jgi:opacity protein-like surface antigen